MQSILLAPLLGTLAATAALPAPSPPLLELSCPLVAVKNGTGVIFDGSPHSSLYDDGPLPARDRLVPLTPRSDGTIPKVPSRLPIVSHCKKAYVLPPSFGRVSLAELSPTSNIDLCPAMVEVQTSVTATLGRIANLDAEIDSYLANFDHLRAEVDSLQAQVSAAARARATADAALVLAVNTKFELQSHVDNAQIDFDTCLLLADNNEECVRESTALSSTQQELYSHIAATLNPALAEAAVAEAEYKRAFAFFSTKLDELTGAIEPIFAFVAELDALNILIVDTYSQYASLEGAVGTLQYSVPWDDVIAAYGRSNPKASWSWLPVPIDSALFVATAIVGGQPTAIPALLWARLPEDQANDTSSGSAGQTVMGSGGMVSATIGLGLAGACPFFPGVGSKRARTLDGAGLAAYVTANVSYRYKVLVSPTFNRYVETSPLVLELKRRLPTFDPLGATKLAKVVRSSLATQSFRDDMTALSTRHTEVQIAVSERIDRTPISSVLAKIATSQHLPLLPLPIRIPPIPKVVYKAVEGTGTLTFLP
jgi:hypothetical protein